MSTGAAPAAQTAAPPQQQQPSNPHLLPLQEDDEFEEFPVEEWDPKDTYGAKLAGATGQANGSAAAGGAAEGGAKALDALWEDDWDDDDVGDDFSVQLRGELLKQQDQMQS